MEKTLTNLLDSKQKTGTVTVKIMQKADNDLYIVADHSSYAILDLTKNPSYNNSIDLHKTYKFMKCTIEHDRIIPSSFKPIKCKTEIIIQVDNNKILEITQKLEKQSPRKAAPKVNLDHIKENTKNNTYISNLTVMVATVSRPIETQRGIYKIATVIDSSNNRADLNLYDKHIDQVDAGKIYTINKIKKITLQNGGESKMRLCANKFSIMIEVTDQKEIDAFDDVIIGDEKVNGKIEAIVDLSFYESCKIHLYKIDSDGNCPACTEKTVQIRNDFTGKMYITTGNDELEIQFFKRQMVQIIGETDDIEKISDALNDMVDKEFTLEYKKNNEEQNILIKIK